MTKKKAKRPLDPRRAESISSTDIAAIAGLNPYVTPWDVYARKTGLVQPVEEIGFGPMHWGTVLEPHLIDAYELVLKVVVKRSGNKTLWHPSRKWQCATPDGRVMMGPKTMRAVEAKTSGRGHRWGDPSKAGQASSVPEEYAIQGAWEMSVTEAMGVDFPVLIGGQQFQIYSLARDMETEAMLLELGENFLRQHLIPRVPPPITASESVKEWLRRRFPKNVEPMKAATEVESVVAERLRVLRAVAEWVNRKVEDYEYGFKAAIGDADGIEGVGWRATWKRTKDSEKTDWEAVANALCDLGGFSRSDMDSVIATHTTIKEGYRRFTFTADDTVATGKPEKAIRLLSAATNETEEEKA